MFEGSQELVTGFNTAVRRLIHLDSAMIILPWEDGSNIAPIKKGNRLPNTRELMDFYVDKTFVTQGEECWSRFRLAHDKCIEHLCDDKNWFRKQGMWFCADDMQVRNHIAAGWFLGSHPNMICKDLKEAIMQHPAMKDIPFAIKHQNIRLTLRGKIPKKDQVRAAHILTEYSRVTEMRSIMKSIYDKPGDIGLPLGIVMRFVPNIADPRYKGNDRTRENCRRLKMKQKNFLDRTDIQPSMALQSIDFSLKDVGTLRQVMMGLEANSSTDEQPMNLFISVEEPYDSTSINFIYRKENADQSTMSALPLILQAHYGPRCGCWLTKHAESETSVWEYDITAGTIKSNDDDYTSVILQGWHGDSDQEDIFSNEIPVVMNHGGNRNQYDDNGTVLTMDSDLSGWSSSSNDQPNVPKMLKKMQRMMAKNISEEDKKNFMDILNGKSLDNKVEGQKK